MSGGSGTAGAAGGTAGAAGGSAAGGAAGQAAGGVAGASAGGAAGSAGGAGGGADPLVARGEYLAKNVLGCAGCHTPQGGASFSGTDCFVNSNGSCLSSANLTNDDTGLKNLSKQQIEDAFRLGKYPNDPTKYLFANMPYYQFANVSDNDADAIVAYLRTLPAVAHAVQANTAPYNVRPTSPENAAVSPNTLPAASPVAGPTNGKYLATLVCVNCHTVDLASSTPKIIDASKAFQGGRSVTTTVNGNSKTLQSANLTPDASGLMSWNITQVANAITMAKDKNGVALCGMRALANMTPSDASDIASYLLAIPPVANTITMTCQ
jgi:mono/diheme cytochrome c family protein